MKSAPSSWMLPLVIFDKKSALLFKNSVILRYFWEKTSPKVPFLKDCRCWPKILDYNL